MVCGERATVRPAASSIASGTPSRCAHSRATASALFSVNSKPDTSAARSQNNDTDS